MQNDGNEELWRIYEEYEKIPDGKEQIEAIRAAVKRADELQNFEWQLCNRHNLMHEIHLYGDKGELFPIIAQYISLYEQNPMKKYRSSYLYWLYASLEQWDFFPHLPLEERKKVADYYFQVLERYHENKSPYYEAEYWQALQEGKMEEAEQHHQSYLKWMKSNPPSIACTCKACHQYVKVSYGIHKQDWNLAMKEAKPFLESRLKCNCQPDKTFSDLMHFALMRGNLKEAKRFASLLEDCLRSHNFDLPYANLIYYYAFTDLEKGMKRLIKWLPELLKFYDQSEKIIFFSHAHVLCKQYAHKYDTASFTLSETFPLYRRDGVYRPAKLADWFYKEALDIAKKFDERNGYPYYQNYIADILEGERKLMQERSCI